MNSDNIGLISQNWDEECLEEVAGDPERPGALIIVNDNFHPAPTGKLRIWTKPGGSLRNGKDVREGGDFVPSGSPPQAAGQPAKISVYFVCFVASPLLPPAWVLKDVAS